MKNKKAKYDPKTGKIELISVSLEKEKKIIRNFDDMQKEKERLHNELKLNSEDVENATPEELSERYTTLYERTEEGYIQTSIGKSDFYAESIDNMRID